MMYKTHKLNVSYHFENINISVKINLNVIYTKLHVYDQTNQINISKDEFDYVLQQRGD